MKQLFLFVTLLSATILSAQKDTSHVTKYYKDGKLRENYVLNRNGNKEGEYKQFTRYGKPYIVGQYKDGNPVGIWEYYSGDTVGFLVEKLDFDQHKELFVDSLRAPGLICGPRYFGGYMLRQEFIQNRIKTDFTDAEKKQYQGHTYKVSFTVDTTTMRPVGISTDDAQLPADIKAKMEKIVADMPAWLPPICKGKEEVWRFSVAFVF